MFFFFFKQKTAYEITRRDWSSDVCSSDLSFAVRSIYMESSSMFVRGGVYVVVRDAMGPFVARLSVSALLFDYILTGPISGVSAGLYLAGLLNKISELLHSDFTVTPAYVAVVFAILVTLYFWWHNIRGLTE